MLEGHFPAKNGPPRLRSKRIEMNRILSIVVGCLLLGTANADITSDVLEQRGKQLHSAIKQTYKQLLDTRSLKPSNDITEVVVRYIPIGTSFDEAEQMLRNSGFRVEHRPSANPPSTFPWRYDVIAVIDSFDWTAFPSKVSVSVNLSPKAPGNYDKVSGIHAVIARSDL
jgi:hypothetical protein